MFGICKRKDIFTLFAHQTLMSKVTTNNSYSVTLGNNNKMWSTETFLMYLAVFTFAT